MIFLDIKGNETIGVRRDLIVAAKSMSITSMPYEPDGNMAAGRRGFVGRLVYGIFALIAAIIGILTLWAGYAVISSGQSVFGGLLLGISGALCLWLAKWCFSPSRKPSKVEF